MTSTLTPGVTQKRPGLGSALKGAVMALALSLLGLSAQATSTTPPKEVALSKEDKVCLDCHAKPGLEKTTAKGEKLKLTISPKAYATSVHADSGCEGCHSDIDLATHEKEPKKLASKRALAVDMRDTCRDCHKKTAKQYDDSVHSAVVRTGGDKAPVCSDCHDPHTTRSAKGQSAQAVGHVAPVQCEQCHQPIAKAYAASVHGSDGGESLECKDCHQTHSIKAAAVGDHIKSQCNSCHRDVAKTHAEWLPNTQRHLDAVSCPACHTPGTTRRVNLMLYEGNVPHQASEKSGVPKFIKLANYASTTPSGLDGRALWSLLQEFNNNGAERKTALRGRLEVQNGVQAHQLGEKKLALRDCDTCHRVGAASFQAVTVSMAGPDGRPLRHEASLGVLNSIESVGSIGGFYAIGSTRIKLLDYLLVLVLAAGIALPMGHLTVKVISKRRRERASAASASSTNDGN